MIFILQLYNVVEYFSKQRKKVLILTRKHQKKLPVFKHIGRHALVFLVDNLLVYIYADTVGFLKYHDIIIYIRDKIIIYIILYI